MLNWEFGKAEAVSATVSASFGRMPLSDDGKASKR